MTTCSIENCERKHYARGWCFNHYQQWWRQGDPLVKKKNPNGHGNITAGGRHRFRTNGKDKLLYQLMVEKTLGREIPKGVEIHHFDGNQGNDVGGNLVVCQDRAYHMLLHLRKRAYDACGNANWRRCIICKQYDEIQNLSKTRNRESRYHLSCIREYNINCRYKRKVKQNARRKSV